MTVPTLAQPGPAFAIPLAQAAMAKRLTLVVGAGVSYPTGLPDGKKLAKLLHESLSKRVKGYTCDQADIEKLPAVATAGEAVLGGRPAIQNLLTTLAAFDTATPTVAHRVFAMLTAEGAIALITTNWDTCFERGSDAALPSFHTLEDVDDSNSPHIFKIHGTANIPSSLILSEAQLSDPFARAGEYVAAHLMFSTVVFVGIGDIAPYVREPIEALKPYLQESHIYIVSPNIVSKWEQSLWSETLPDLDDQFKVAEDANTFAEHLAHGWLSILIERVGQLLIDDEPALGALDNLRRASRCSRFLTWIRSARTAWPLGIPVVTSEAAKLLIIAICKMAAAETNKLGIPATLSTRLSSAIVIQDQTIHIAAFHETKPSGEIERDLRDHVRQIANTTGTDVVKLLSSATVVGHRFRALSNEDILNDYPAEDVFGGPGPTTIEVQWADEIAQRGA